jgi:LAGLIDADG endonuclease/LAGLIDADG-like domain
MVGVGAVADASVNKSAAGQAPFSKFKTNALAAVHKAVTYAQLNPGVKTKKRKQLEPARLKEMTDVEKSYIAGFIDGDGSVFIGNGTMPVITIRQTIKKKDILEYIQQTTGIGSLSVAVKQSSKTQEQHHWHCSLTESVALAGVLHPYLREKAGKALVMSKMDISRNQRQLNTGLRAEFEVAKKKELKVQALESDKPVHPEHISEYGKLTLQVDIHYLAAFTEAEGSFMININKGKCSLRIGVGQKARWILYQYVLFFEYGAIYKNNSNGCSEWVVTDMEQGYFFMAQILPHVKSYAIKAQIDLIMTNGVNVETKELLNQYKAQKNVKA